MTVHARVHVIFKARIFLSLDEAHRTGLVAARFLFLDDFRMSLGLALKAERSWRILPAVLRFGGDYQAAENHRSANQYSDHKAPDRSIFVEPRPWQARCREGPLRTANAGAGKTD